MPHPDGGLQDYHPGMSKTEVYAAIAMLGLVIRGHESEVNDRDEVRRWHHVATKAKQVANCMTAVMEA